jgi:GT2 family glycosyltransferase
MKRDIASRPPADDPTAHRPADLCVVIVADEGNARLGAGLISVLDRAGWLDLEVVIVDNGSGGASEYIESNFIDVRAIRCPGRGVGYASNRAIESSDARYMLFVDPETLVLDGNLSALVAALDRRPEVGLAGVRQLRADGSPAPSIERFPPPFQIGFMLVRRAAFESSGWFDERFLAFAEGADLWMRLKRAGWEIVHMPHLTVRSRKHLAPANARLEAHAAYARLQFARKHFPHVAPEYRWALAAGYALRVGLYSLLPRYGGDRRRAALAALATVLKGRAPLEERSAH